jgi:hypothetical protein
MTLAGLFMAVSLVVGSGLRVWAADPFLDWSPDSPVYASPGVFTASCTVQAPPGVTMFSLIWHPNLPSGWTLLTVVGDGSPEYYNGSGEIVFTDPVLGNNGTVDFVYTVNVPGGHIGARIIQPCAEFHLEGEVNPRELLAAPVTVEANTAPVVLATHACEGYRPTPSSTVVSNSLAYPVGQPLASLIWTPMIPAGWSLISVAGHGDPAVSDGTNIVFKGSLTNNPLAFTYTVGTSGNLGETNSIRGRAEVGFSGLVGTIFAFASPDPLVVYRYHSADYQSPHWRIDPTELNRVYGYWRVGGYHVDTNGLDGYAPGP